MWTLYCHVASILTHTVGVYDGMLIVVHFSNSLEAVKHSPSHIPTPSHTHTHKHAYTPSDLSVVMS